MTKKSIVPKEIESYIEIHSDRENDILEELTKETIDNVPGAHMLTGPIAGKFLAFISKLMNPKCVLEIGTYTGYSAICLSEGIPSDGIIHTIDIDDRWQVLRDKYWKKANILKNIKQHIGDGMSILKSISIVPDLVFIDADKKQYWDYFQHCISIMKSGGVIIVDNVLFDGEVILPEAEQRKVVKHINHFNHLTLNEDRVEKLMLPIRDGMTIFRIK